MLPSPSKTLFSLQPSAIRSCDLLPVEILPNSFAANTKWPSIAQVWDQFEFLVFVYEPFVYRYANIHEFVGFLNNALVIIFVKNDVFVIIPKQSILASLQSALQERIALSQAAVASAREAQAEDTKSSAGDKYETGREMMQIEIEKHTQQILKAEQLMKELDALPFQKDFAEVAPGALVHCNNGLYFCAIGWGRLDIEEGTVFVISLNSPIGQVLKGQRKGDAFDFHGRRVEVLSID